MKNYHISTNEGKHYLATSEWEKDAYAGYFAAIHGSCEVTELEVLEPETAELTDLCMHGLRLQGTLKGTIPIIVEIDLVYSEQLRQFSAFGQWFLTPEKVVHFEPNTFWKEAIEYAIRSAVDLDLLTIPSEPGELHDDDSWREGH